MGGAGEGAMISAGTHHQSRSHVRRGGSSRCAHPFLFRRGRALHWTARPPEALRLRAQPVPGGAGRGGLVAGRGQARWGAGALWAASRERDAEDSEAFGLFGSWAVRA